MTKIINLPFSTKNKFQYNCKSWNSLSDSDEPRLGERIINLLIIDYFGKKICLNENQSRILKTELFDESVSTLRAKLFEFV